MGNGVREGPVEFQRDVEPITTRIPAEVRAGAGLGVPREGILPCSGQIPPGILHLETLE